MPSTDLRSVLGRIAARARDEYGVDIGLDRIAGVLDEAEALDARTLSSVRHQLIEQRSVLQSADDDLRRLIAAARVLEPIVRLTAEGWPTRRVELTEAIEQDPATGLAAWMTDWCQAAVDRRADLLTRLEDEIPLPDGAGLLHQRARAGSLGFQLELWAGPPRLLEAALEDAEVGGGKLLPPTVLEQVPAAIARFAAAAAPDAEFERWVERVEGSGAQPGLAEALRARRARRFGDESEADRLAARAYDAAPTDMDVIVEAIPFLRGKASLYAALEAARAAVDALPSLIDLDGIFTRLATAIPSEIWLAVAERARRERDIQLVVEALDAAGYAADPQAWDLRALIAEEGLAVLADGSSEERAAALVGAADARIFASDVPVAKEHYEQALSLVPDNPAAAIGLADCLVSLSSAELIDRRRTSLERVLDLLHRVRSPEIDEAYPWAPAIEAYAYLGLADTSAEREQDYSWRALLLGEQSTAREPDEVKRWQLLVDSTTQLGLHRVALAFADRALTLAASDDTEDYRRQAQANLGRFEEALASWPTEESQWHRAVRGYILAMMGRQGEALEVLGSTALEPAWTWARGVLIKLLWLAGEEDAARTEAGAVLTYTGYVAEPARAATSTFGSLEDVAMALLALGRVTEAWRLAQPELAKQGPTTRWPGITALLHGASEQGMDDLRRVLAATPVARDLFAWTNLERPMTERFAADLGVRLPDLDVLNPVVEKRRHTLEVEIGPEAELREMSPSDADPAVVAAAQAGGLVLLALATGDTEATIELAATNGPISTDPAFAALREDLEAARAEGAKQDRLTASLHALLDAGPNERSSSEAVRALQDFDPLDVAWGAFGEFDADAMRRLAARVEAVVSANPQGPAAELYQALASMLPQDADGDAEVRVEMPLSWFAGHSDPRSDHHFFLRDLPNLRVLSPETVPAVRVTAEPELEPDGYRIWIRGQRVVEGHADPALRWADQAALRFLPASLQPAAPADVSTGRVGLDADQVRFAGALAELLTLSHYQVVADAIGRAVANDRSPIHADAAGA